MPVNNLCTPSPNSSRPIPIKSSKQSSHTQSQNPTDFFYLHLSQPFNSKPKPTRKLSHTNATSQGRRNKGETNYRLTQIQTIFPLPQPTSLNFLLSPSPYMKEPPSIHKSSPNSTKTVTPRPFPSGHPSSPSSSLIVRLHSAWCTLKLKTCLKGCG